MVKHYRYLVKPKVKVVNQTKVKGSTQKMVCYTEYTPIYI